MRVHKKIMRKVIELISGRKTTDVVVFSAMISSSDKQYIRMSLYKDVCVGGGGGGGVGGQRGV